MISAHSKRPVRSFTRPTTAVFTLVLLTLFVFGLAFSNKANADSFGVFPKEAVTIGGYIYPQCSVYSYDAFSSSCATFSKPPNYIEDTIPTAVFPQEDIYILSSKITWAQNSFISDPGGYATIGCKQQVSTFWNWIDAYVFNSTNFVNGYCNLSDGDYIFIQNQQPDGDFPFAMFTITYIPASASSSPTMTTIDWTVPSFISAWFLMFFMMFGFIMIFKKK